VTPQFKWFEIFRLSRNESEGTYLRANTGAAAVIRYARRCGGDPGNFYAVEVAAPKGRAAV
jgi:hypothetical protein